jgi:hypothetical protein
MSILSKGKFWSLLIAVVIFIIRYFMPSFPVDDANLANILTGGIAGILFLFGIVIDQEVALRKQAKMLMKLQK